jgi:hypothetical protein
VEGGSLVRSSSETLLEGVLGGVGGVGKPLKLRRKLLFPNMMLKDCAVQTKAGMSRELERSDHERTEKKGISACALRLCCGDREDESLRRNTAPC